MQDSNHPQVIGLLLSGGIDSAVLLDQLLRRGSRVAPFYVRSNCIWEDVELATLRKFLAAVARSNLEELVVFDMPVADLYANHWSLSGGDVPDQDSPDEAVFLPGRNPLLLLKPALWCAAHGARELALATLASNPFADATPEFFAQFREMIRVATGGDVEIIRPFESMSKRDVLQLGGDVPLELTFSCLAPVGGLHCGQCNKCAERRSAFAQLGTHDPTTYANQKADAIAPAVK
jgi:7-cyano-7-deazaguanine synthase